MTKAEEPKTTPMMEQWFACKKSAKEALLFFRMGDFYEAFYDDASIIAKELDLTLTSRQGIPMSGVPHHTCENYIDKLINKGYRVAIAEQIGDPKQTKGIVRREVVRVVTPGTVINSSLLSEKANNFFVSIAQIGSLFGLAYLDLTTAEFNAIEFEKKQELLNEIYRLRPSEFLVPKRFFDNNKDLFTDLQGSYKFLLNQEDDWKFDHQIAYDFLVNHFKVHSLDGFGLKGMVAAINAAGALAAYLQECLHLPIDHIQSIQTYSNSSFMTLDYATQTNLELTSSLSDGTKRNTLLSILDHTCTPMGGRLLRNWVKQPLLDVEKIRARQDAVLTFMQNPLLLEKLGSHMSRVKDLERLMMKISAGYATPRDIVALKCSFEPLPQIKGHLSTAAQDSELLRQLAEKINPLPKLIQLIGDALVEEPPVRLTDGKIFRDGYSKELDELREISRNSKSWIARYQANLREQTDIKTLKVGFNKMFGYYIEISKGQADKAPSHFQRRQTLVNAERFITPELKDYETKVLTAEEQISSIEQELFTQIREEAAKYSAQVQLIAKAIAQVDALLGLGLAARRYGYTKPYVDDSKILNISGGRHPVIEATNLSEKFVPNDTLLDDDENKLILITGPNMAGKSTYIRQVALITIMAQIGSFVPAESAHIGICDKVFTRIGASDDLARGQSTFMVEMTETANILNNATSRSLVVLDEIGRGTSTYDGISIAWSVAEFLLTTEGKTPKTLFATHYFELTKLEEKVPGAVNYNVAVHESEDHIVFLRKIVKGGTDKSYGIHVGRLAGLPMTVIERSKEILLHLEENANQKNVFEPSKPKKKPKSSPTPDKFQLTFFG